MLVSAPDQGQSAPAGRGRSAVIWLPGRLPGKLPAVQVPKIRWSSFGVIGGEGLDFLFQLTS